MTMLPPGANAANPNAAMLNQPSGAPEAGQFQLAAQQTASESVQDEKTAAAANIQKISNFAREIASEQNTAENRATAMKTAYGAGVQMVAGGGQAKRNLIENPEQLALIPNSDFIQTGKRLFG